MSADRLTRINELIKREVAGALFRVMDETGFDLAAVSVTRVVVSSDLRTARVLVSILGHEHERALLLAQLRRHRAEIQGVVARNVIIKYTPTIHFELDDSVEKGDHVLALLDKLAESGDTPPSVDEPL